jgi:murein DD-endopeptidase MepM/ murein hydrolase activator NlpD
MKLNEMPFRKCDDHGCGHWHAGRGSRLHNGVDLECVPGTTVDSPISGVITKLGIVYADDLHWRYVQISAGKYNFRLFYVDPTVSKGDVVVSGQPVGTHQALGGRYPGITEHVHFEIKDAKGEYIDPTPTLLVMGG